MSVTVLGHLYPDVDSLISGTLMAELLRFLGDSGARFVLLSPLDEITEAVRARLGVPVPPIVPPESLRGCKVFLVDHSTPIESVGSSVQVDVVGIVDHHIDAGFQGCPDKEVRLVGSATQLVFNRMVSAGFPNASTDKRIALWCATALAVDTACLMTTKTGPEDRAIMDRFQAVAEITDADLLRSCVFETDFTSDPAKLARNGYKEYFLANRWQVRSSYAEIIEPAEWKDAAISRIVSELEKQVLQSDRFALGVFVVRDFGRKQTWAALVGKLASDVVRLNGGKPIFYDCLAGRGTDVMPLVSTLLEKLALEESPQ